VRVRNANKVAYELAFIGKACNANEARVWKSDVLASLAEVNVGNLPQFL
jgi:hypothetical protein